MLTPYKKLSYRREAKIVEIVVKNFAKSLKVIQNYTVE